MLAYTEVRPSLTRLEEMKLQRVISRCTGESGKRYSDFGQVLKALPQIPEAEFAKPQGKKQRLKRIAGGVGLGVAACLCLCVLLGVEKKSLVKAEEEAIYNAAKTEGEEEAKKEYEDKLRTLKEEQDIERTAREAAGQAAKAGETAADTAEQLRIQELEQELVTVYDRLLESETDPAKAEEIKKKKTEIEKTP